jgi:hypothetical protein
MRVIVMGLLGPGFWGRVFDDGLLWTELIEPGGRMLDRSLTEVERMFDGREGGRVLHIKMDGCWSGVYRKRLSER